VAEELAKGGIKDLNKVNSTVTRLSSDLEIILKTSRATSIGGNASGVLYSYTRVAIRVSSVLSGYSTK